MRPSHFALLLSCLILFSESTFAETFSVTRFDDPATDGCDPLDCSLREAVIAANSSNDTDMIELSAGRYFLEIAGGAEDAAATGDLDLTESVSIAGASRGQTIVDGRALDRIFHIPSNSVTVTISNLSIQNGDATVAENGGGIFNNGGTLTLTSVALLDNFADDGGGLANHSGGTATIIDSRINSNRANTNGAGIDNEASTLVVNDSDISDNKIVNNCCNGGGIANEDTDASATITNSTIRRNFAGANGGGVYTFTSASSRLRVVDSDISHNQADSNGGGLYITALTGEVENSSVMGNFAGSNAGGIYTSGPGSISIKSSSIIGNVAGNNTGGMRSAADVASITDTTVAGNIAVGDGGGIRSFSDQQTITNVTVSGNLAYGDGGGIDIAGNDDVVTITNSTIIGNIADAEDDVTGDGGGIDNSNGSTVTVTNSIFARNVNGDQTDTNCSATTALTSGGNNLDSDGSCSFASSGDITGQDPALGPLTDNGGNTLTHLPLPGSPAIDAASNASCSATDQRGLSRPVDSDDDGTATCEIGSVEVVDDCNENNVPDTSDISSGTSEDCNSNNVPDECESDSDDDDIPDACDVCAGLPDVDDNENGVIDCVFDQEFHALLADARSKLSVLKKKTPGSEKQELKDLLDEIRSFVTTNGNELALISPQTDLDSLATKAERKVDRATAGRRFKRHKRRAGRALQKLDDAVVGLAE